MSKSLTKSTRFKKQAWLFAGLVFLVFAFLFLTNQRTYHTEMPLKLDDSGLPCINISIQNTSYPVTLDVGSRLPLKLYEEVLEPIEKQPYRTESWKNFRGQQLGGPTYWVPQIELGSLTLKKIEAVAFPSNLCEIYTVWKASPDQEDIPEEAGNIGQGILKHMAILLDVQQSRVIFSNQHNKLKKDGYDLNTFTKVPMAVTPKGTFVSVMTDLGPLKLFVDTGCTLTLLHEDLYPSQLEPNRSRHGFLTLTSKTFNMSSTDFGSQKLYFIDMPKDVNDYDGILGMDFFKKHTVYIDFPHQAMYVKPSTSK